MEIDLFRSIKNIVNYTMSVVKKYIINTLTKVLLYFVKVFADEEVSTEISRDDKQALLETLVTSVSSDFTLQINKPVRNHKREMKLIIVICILHIIKWLGGH